MRPHLLSLCFISLALAGCSTPYKPVKPFPSDKRHPATNSSSHHSAAKPSPVQLYHNLSDLASKPFRDMGEVSGEECQTTLQDNPANLSTARKRMQSKAEALQANAVLIHQCEVISNRAGCVRQAICQGSALVISR